MFAPIHRQGLFSLLLLASFGAQAQQPAQQENFNLVTTEAVTVAGHEFCRHFIDAWRDQPGSDAVALSLVERPSARWGSTVWVQSRQRRLLQLRLPPARAQLAALAVEAADSVLRAALDSERERRLVNDADLAPDEI